MTRGPGVFFVHIMKTGGVSLGRMLRGALTGDTYPDPERGEGPSWKYGVDRLLDLSAERRADIGFYTVHQPAWVADALEPDFVKVTLLREPVERTVSHLRHISRMEGMPSDLEAIYDDEGWRMRLSDLQTRVFAEDAETHASHRQIAAATKEVMDAADLRRALDLAWSTGVANARELGDADLSRALGMLETFDEVGTTGDLASMARRIASRLGRDLPTPSHHNAAPASDPIPEALRQRIVHDTQRDAELFRRASELAAD